MSATVVAEGADAARIEPVGPGGGTSQPGRKVDPRNLALRTFTGVVLAVVALLAVWAGEVPFGVVSSALCLVGIAEFCALARGMGVEPAQPVALGGGLLVLAVATLAPAAWRGHGVLEWHGCSLALTTVLVLVLTLLTGRRSGATRPQRGLDALATCFGILYVGWLFGFALLLRRAPGTVELAGGWTVDAGALWVVLFVITTAASDIGCYGFGKMLGRTPLAPAVSPNKTVEGSLGGLLVSVAVAVGVGALVRGLAIPAAGGGTTHLAGLSLPLLALYGAVVAGTGQMGDLWESMLKREAGVKDSGSIIAGHGGVLDRFDSYFFSAPVAYVLTLLMVG